MDESGTPSFRARPVTGRGGAVATLRLLEARDAARFGDFLDALSDATRRRFAPHPLDRDAARRICADLDDGGSWRFVLTDPQDDSVMAYLLVQFLIPQDEKARYARAGWVLEDGKDCRIAPVVADHLQGCGWGTELLEGVIDALGRRGCRRVVLFGGTQASNHRAIRAYEKAGFVPVGAFDERGVANVDMGLSLGHEPGF
ncbi:GNAT family N-acetyltransferase [Streptomyces sp. NPDC015492]|uniref:GNAT family N-acetyltransferase n=1 Tax=Streptomyces sp. NPDC015492 TaxID=3364958 RepID=UPI0036F6E0B3